MADKENSQNYIEGEVLRGPLLKYWPFQNIWIDVSSCLKTLPIKGFDDYQKQVKWETNNGKYSHESCELIRLP